MKFSACLANRAAAGELDKQPTINAHVLHIEVQVLIKPPLMPVDPPRDGWTVQLAVSGMSNRLQADLMTILAELRIEVARHAKGKGKVMDGLT